MRSKTNIFMSKIIIAKNPFLLFAPFLIIYIALVLLAGADVDEWDAAIYLRSASNLLEGYFSPPAPDIYFSNGPGYPLLILPLVYLRLPLESITILNAIIYYLSIILIFKVIIRFTNFRVALIFSLFWALYYNSIDRLREIGYTTFVTFLVALIVYLIVKAFDRDSKLLYKKYLFLAGFSIGYLSLTLASFAYVLLLMLIGMGVLLMISRNSEDIRKGFMMLIIAFITTAPYFSYTYRLTGKLYYFSTNGGSNLYWMTTPYENEYGSWFNYVSFEIKSIEKFIIPGGEEAIKKNHRKDFEEFFKYKSVEQDDAYKRIAINNIKNHPAKFGRNCVSNIGRILFNMPYSYSAQTDTSLIRLPFNGIIVVLMLFSLIPTYLNWKKIPFSIKFLLLFTLIFLSGNVLGSSETRVFSYIVPVLLIWIAFMLKKSLEIKLKFDN